MQHTYSITGMTCQSCAEKVQKALESLEAVEKAEVNLEQKTVRITMRHHMEPEQLNQALKPLEKYTLHPPSLSQRPRTSIQEKSLKTYWPLLLVFLYLIAGTLYLSWQKGNWSTMEWMPNFMGLFFVSFAFFKLLDLKGFAASYLSYDLLTKAWPTWGYLYPFAELTLGALYLLRLWPAETYVATLLVMGVSIVGVIQSVVQKREIQCACLGTGFNLPMSTITIVEDALMIAMAAWMLIF